MNIYRPSLRTEVHIEKSKKELIGYDIPQLMIGSCFTEHMGKYFKEHGLPINVNPTGIQYNPLSILKTLERIDKKLWYNNDELFFSHGLWHSFDAHGSLSCTTAEETREKLNSALEETHNHFFKHKEEKKTLLITFGTAWIYTLKTSHEVVSNCHKQPDTLFERKLYSTEQIITPWKAYIAELIGTHPHLHIIYTVSPIRHLRDGLHANQLSKATLLLAIQELVQLFPEHVSYFPAYEIILDELRDYRFYTDDMCHIADEGITYVRNIFTQYAMSKHTETIMHDVARVHSMYKHRPLHNSEDAKEFEQKKEDEKKQLLELYPFLPSSLFG